MQNVYLVVFCGVAWLALCYYLYVRFSGKQTITVEYSAGDKNRFEKDSLIDYTKKVSVNLVIDQSMSDADIIGIVADLTISLSDYLNGTYKLSGIFKEMSDSKKEVQTSSSIESYEWENLKTVDGSPLFSEDGFGEVDDDDKIKSSDVQGLIDIT